MIVTSNKSLPSIEVYLGGGGEGGVARQVPVPPPQILKKKQEGERIKRVEKTREKLEKGG